MRSLLLALVTLAGTALLSALLTRSSIGALLPLHRWASPAAPSAALTDLLVGVLTAIGALVAGWYAVSALLGALCALTQLCGATWRSGERVLRQRGAPGVARLVGAGAGAVLAAGLSLTPAQAEAPEPTPEPTVAEDLTWAAAAREATPDQRTEEGNDAPEPASSAPDAAGSPTEAGEAPGAPTEVSEPASSPESAPPSSTPPASASPSTTSPPPSPPSGTTPEAPPTSHGTSSPTADDNPPTTEATSGPDGATRPSPPGPVEESADYIVQPGDTLWAIAAEHLGPAADDAQIAAAWPAWYRVNAAAIGADPNLIVPGTALHEPS